MSLDPRDWLWSAFTFLVDQTVGRLLDFLLDLLLQAIGALFNFNPIDLEAEWWRSTYAYFFYFGFTFSAPIGIGYALFHLAKGSFARSIQALFLFGKVLVVGGVIPLLYGGALVFSSFLTKAARMGHSQEELLGSLDIFDDLGSLNPLISGFYGLWLMFLAFGIAIIMLLFEYLAWFMGLGAVVFYVTKDVGGKGAWLWNKMVTYSFVVLVAPPLMTFIQTIGYMFQQNVDTNSPIDMLQPDALVFCLILTAVAFVPTGLSHAFSDSIVTFVRGGRLDKAGKDKIHDVNIVGGNEPARESLGWKAFGLVAEHKLDIVAAASAAHPVAGLVLPPPPPVP